MKKFLFIALLLSFLAAHSNETKIFDIANKSFTDKIVSTAPQIKSETRGDTIIIYMNFDYVEIEQIDSLKVLLSFDGFGHNQIQGEQSWPRLDINFPCINDEYEFKVVSHDFVDIDFRIADVSEDIIDQSYDYGEEKSDSNHSCTQQVCDKFIPLSVVNCHSIQYYRGKGIIPISFTPIQYNHYSGISRITKGLILQLIQHGNSSLNSNKIINEKYLACTDDDKTYESLVAPSLRALGISNNNYTDKIEPGEIVPSLSSQSYLILTSRKFAPVAQKLSDWKTLLGYKVTTQMPALFSPWNCAKVKKIISDFAMENPDLYYVIIIGDHNNIPANEFLHHNLKYGIFVSDFPYSCLDGENDFIPDIAVGRIPCSTLEEASSAIDKIIDYELHPVTDTDFYRNVFFVGEFDEDQEIHPNEGMEDRMFIYTSENIRNSLADGFPNLNVRRIYGTDSDVNPKYWSTFFVNSELTEIPKELQRTNFSWDGKPEDIAESINDGAFLGMYRGHGSPQKWGTRINFSSENVKNDLTNDKYPIVFSVTCQTGAYNKDEHSLAATLLNCSKKGSVGVIAASEASYSGKNDVLAGALFRSVFPGSGISNFPRGKDSSSTLAYLDEADKLKLCNLGKILNFADGAVFTHYGYDSKNALITSRLFHCFGDPSLLIRTKAPKQFRDVIVENTFDGFNVTGSGDGIYMTVVDTVRRQIIYHNILRDCYIPVDNPEDCKLCFFGKSICPLIVDGEYGYDAGRIKNLPGFKFDRYANFSTGQYEDSSSLSFDANTIDFKCIQCENNEFEVIVNGALVKDAIPIPETENWYIMGGEQDFEDLGEPLLPYVLVTLEKFDNIDYSAVSLSDSEFVDFENVNCCPYYDKLDCDPPYIDWIPISPFGGFKPTKQIELWTSSNKSKYVTYCVYPVMYNYYSKTMRCYNKMKFNIKSQKNDIQEINTELNKYEYFTIDGHKVINPEKGQMYIKKSLDRIAKIIY